MEKDLANYDQTNYEVLPAAVLKIKRLPLPKDFFNTAAYNLDKNENSPSGPVLLLGRYVTETAQKGEPDIGTLAVAVIEQGRLKLFKEVWRPDKEPKQKPGDLLEDPRILPLNDEKLMIGFTRLAIADGQYRPFPALATTTVSSLINGSFPNTTLMSENVPRGTPPPNDTDSFLNKLTQGKNMLPIDKNKAIFRPESEDHRFVVFSLNKRRVNQPTQKLEIPEIPYWGEQRMGLTSAPLWINKHAKNEAILLLHGFHNVNGLLRYHVGSSRLWIDKEGRYGLDNISPEPLFSPSMLAKLYPNEQVERHSDERESMYCCAALPIYDSLGNLERARVFLSVGDTRTLEADISASAIIESWHWTEKTLRAQCNAA